MTKITAKDQIYIYGAGYCGALLTQMMLQVGIHPVAIMDRDEQKWKMSAFDIPIIPPQYRKCDYVIVALLKKGDLFLQLKTQLCEMGFQENQIVHIYEIEHPTLFQEQKLVIRPNARLVLERKKDWIALRDKLSDEESKQVCDQAYAFLMGDTESDFFPHEIAEQYFAYDIYEKTQNEAVIDCGGFKGEVMRQFLKNVAGEFQHYTIIEPDLMYDSWIREQLTPKQQEKVEIIPCALSDRQERLYLTNYLGMNSVLTRGGGSGNIVLRWKECPWMH
jgi:threonine dehydrogenase-like Zn-dependent dehydrogenase